ADQNDELMILDLEIDAFYGLDPAVVFLHDLPDGHFSHSNTVPSVRVSRASALGRTSGQTGYVVVHQKCIDDDGRQRCQQVRGHDLAPLEHVAADQVGDDADGQNHLVGRIQVCQRIQERTPADGE